MLATTRQEGDPRVEYVVVRRTGSNGVEEVDEEAVSNSDRAVNNIVNNIREVLPSPSATQIHGKASSPAMLVTMTITPTRTFTQAAATGGVALADNDPTETIVISMQPPPGSNGRKGGVSETTQHLLIAAGSIGATIIIVMLVLGLYTMRKRGLTLAQALRAGRYQVTHGGPPPPPKYQNEYRDMKQASDYGSMRSQSIPAPQPAMINSGSISSQRPAVAPERNDSFNIQHKPSQRNDTTFHLDAPPPGRNNSHHLNETQTPSSNALGPNSNNAQGSLSTRNPRSIVDEESQLQYNGPQSQDAAASLSPLPPPPTFKQFLFNRPSVSGKPAPGNNMMSRFSWTNSNSPQTPHDTSRDTNIHTTQQAQGRDSYITTRSSAPRFRTIDSWVGQQTNRIEEQRLKDQFRLTASTVTSSSSEEEGGCSEARDRVPEVPAMPKNVQALRESSAQISSQLPDRRPVSPTLPGLPGRNVRHKRQQTGSTVDTAPIFRQHPGTELRFSMKSDVPSEILDRGRMDNALS